MTNDLHNLYCRCFPEYPLTLECFHDSLKPDTGFTHVIRALDADETIGFIIICNNAITLICVLEEYRGKGYGKWLLNEAEKYIRANVERKALSTIENKEIILGFAEHYIFQGVPSQYDSIGFFEKYGYTAEETTTNMELKLADFDIDKLNLNKPDDVSFRIAEDADKPALLVAIEDAGPQWLPYFDEFDEEVMLVISEGKIIGFQMLDVYGARFKAAADIKAGCIGCVGVINEARERGIGRWMVAEGICWLKEQGCVSIELLYVAIVKWYEKLGFYTVSEQWMGSKPLTD